MIRKTFGRIAIAASAAFVIAGVIGACARPAAAQTAGTTAAPAPAVATRFFGKVTAIDTTANTISLHNKKKGDMTFTITSDTKVHVNRQKATVADIHPGMFAMVRSLDGKSAKMIMAHDGRPGKAPNAAASPATSPTTPAQ